MLNIHFRESGCQYDWRAIHDFLSIVAFMISEVDHLPPEDRRSDVLAQKLRRYSMYMDRYARTSEERARLRELVDGTELMYDRITGGRIML